MTSNNPISSWDEWDPIEYLNTYYGDLIGDTHETLKFLNKELKADNIIYDSAIEIGAGPTLFGVLSIAPYVKKIDIAEYLPQNREEVKNWVDEKENAFNWDHAVKYLLNLNSKEGTTNSIAEYTDLTRKKVEKIIPCDISQHWPLSEKKEKYDLLLSLFCADSCTDSKVEWMHYMHNLLHVLKPGGTALIGALKDCESYRVGNKYFPCANVSEKDIERFLLEDPNEFEDVSIHVAEVPECEDEGFSEVMFAKIRMGQ
jgi:hypothetical protein